MSLKKLSDEELFLRIIVYEEEISKYYIVKERIKKDGVTLGKDDQNAIKELISFILNEKKLVFNELIKRSKKYERTTQNN